MKTPFSFLDFMLGTMAGALLTLGVEAVIPEHPIMVPIDHTNHSPVVSRDPDANLFATSSVYLIGGTMPNGDAVPITVSVNGRVLAELDVDQIEKIRKACRP